MTEFISSPANKLIKEVASLHNKKYRDNLGKFLAEGVRLVEECAISGWPIEFCLYTESAASHDRTLRLIKKLAAADCQMIVVPESVYNKISDTEQPQGIMAVLKKRRYAIEDMMSAAGNKLPLLVILDGIQDPGNVGTIIRTADAAGCTGVIALKGSADVYAGKTVRAAMGSLFHLPIVEGVSAAELVTILNKFQINLLATGLQKKSVLYYQANFNRPVCIILGNEGQGVSKEMLEAADACLNIPLAGQAESLNVSVAAGIILYEAIRQRATL
ncbi:TrmH family RNA methyltransferase [Sporomusa aerivorans]|uniref:TrmH family RNA methyltransferase n=1 Tax=Sporomusa aerivorans TaxID=204936 RepID=UPI00352A1481